MDSTINNFPQFFSGIGLGLMVLLAGTGSAIGLYITGSTVIGVIKKKPESFGMALVLAALPSTQGLYGFVGAMLYFSYAQSSVSFFQNGIIFGAGLALGIVCLFSAIKQGQVCAAGINAIGNGFNTFGQTLILAAFVEFYAILALVAIILMAGLIK